MFITLRLLEARGDLLSLFFLAQLTLQFYFLLSAPYTADPGLPSPSLRSTCISAATAAQTNSATSFGSSSLCPFMPLTHGSVSCSSPMTSTMFTLAQCGTAMKVRRGQTENGGGMGSLCPERTLFLFENVERAWLSPTEWCA